MIETNWAPPAQSTIPAPVNTDWIQERLTGVGGLNRFDQPNYRIVWSNSRMELAGGEFDTFLPGTEIFLGVKVTDPIPVQKYFTTPDRFVVEQWRPPEDYAVSEEQWYRLTSELHEGRWIPTLGPFPSQGDYEPAWVLEDKQGNYLEPNEIIVMELLQRILAGRERFNSADRRKSIFEREVKKEKSAESTREAIVRDATSGFPGNSEIILTDNCEGVQNVEQHTKQPERNNEQLSN